MKRVLLVLLTLISIKAMSQMEIKEGSFKRLQIMLCLIEMNILTVTVIQWH